MASNLIKNPNSETGRLGAVASFVSKRFFGSLGVLAQRQNPKEKNLTRTSLMREYVIAMLYLHMGEKLTHNKHIT